jgi:hypothetical protein
MCSWWLLSYAKLWPTVILCLCPEVDSPTEIGQHAKIGQQAKQTRCIICKYRADTTKNLKYKTEDLLKSYNQEVPPYQLHLKKICLKTVVPPPLSGLGTGYASTYMT